MRASRTSLVCSLFLIVATLAAQDRDQQMFNRMARGKAQVNPDEMVSFKSDYTYNRAMQDLSDMAKKFTGKIIVDTSPIKDDTVRQIGANVQSMYWRDALEVILKANNNWYDEESQYFLVYNAAEGKKEAGLAPLQPKQKGTVQGPAAQAVQIPAVDSGKVVAETREVTVSAIFLQLNESKLSQHGISFSISRGNDVNLQFTLTGADLTGPFGGIVAPTKGKLALDVAAAISFFENEGYGEIVSRPVIRVRDGASSVVQIGQSIPFLTKDFQGNTVQNFIDAGTILRVSPKVYDYNGTSIIDLKYDLDKSAPGASATGGLEIDHNKVTGSLLMLDGERTYVSGLISTTQTTNRSGIPFLKDLPWWVFGLRYIFGADQVNSIKQELIVIIDAKLEQTAEMRASNNSKNTQKSSIDKARQLRDETDKLMKKD